MKNVILIFALLPCLHSFAQSKSTPPAIGIVESLERDSLLNAAGYTCLVESIQKICSPRKVSETQFQQTLAILQHVKTPLYALNIFIPSDLKLVGPDVREDSILAYSRKVFQRVRALGVTMIVWGSGGARRVPEGFDHGRATDQFVSVAKKVAALAREYDIVIVLENLNQTETNFINRLEDAVAIARRVNHPNFRICADIYHMLKENESPDAIVKAKKYLVHCDIAEKENRTPPGVKGDDFRPYLAALKKANYRGRIILECRWENVATQAAPARIALAKQLDDVYGK